MNSHMLGESSGPSAKRKRGRPRKDASLKSQEPMAPASPKSQEPMAPTILGREVTCTIEDSFGPGYVLSVKIGNSIMRGVFYEPEHLFPVVPENVTPRRPIITRSISRKIREEEVAARKGKQPGPEMVVDPEFSDTDFEIANLLSMLNLQPLHKNKIGHEVHNSEEPIAATQMEFEEMPTTEADGKNSSHDGAEVDDDK